MSNPTKARNGHISPGNIPPDNKKLHISQNKMHCEQNKSTGCKQNKQFCILYAGRRKVLGLSVTIGKIGVQRSDGEKSWVVKLCSTVCPVALMESYFNRDLMYSHITLLLGRNHHLESLNSFFKPWPRLASHRAVEPLNDWKILNYVILAKSSEWPDVLFLSKF